jgi:hypothetical protein
MTQPLLPDRNRRLQYLRGLADQNWGVPTGFGGRTCFHAIPPLELEKCELDPGFFDWSWIDYSLELLRHRRDCQDFSMVGLLRILLRYPHSRLLTEAQRDEIVSVLTAAKFSQEDPGEDSCCWLTENHQIQYLSSEYLTGQLFPEKHFATTGNTGSWHMQRARTPLLHWLSWRFRFSFSEWNSSCYSDEDAAALLNLAEFCGDPAIRQQAATVLSLLVFHLSLNSLGTIPAGSRGRAYLEDQLFPGASPVGVLLQLIWGADTETSKPAPGLAATLLAAGDFSFSRALIQVGCQKHLELENKERHGLDPEEANLHGIDPGDVTNFPLFAGAGLEHHHLVAEARRAHYRDIERWPGYFYSSDFYRRCKEQGLDFDPHALPHACSRAEVYSFQTPHYHLGCAQSYRPGSPGYQQFIWCATLGVDTVVFTTNPAPPDVPYGRPGPWVGHGVLPKVVQYRNVLVAMHRVRPCPIYDQPPWFREDRVHAFFPRCRFDEIVDRAGWCLARKGDAFIALKPVSAQSPVWKPAAELSERLGSDLPYEWDVADTDVTWICEMGCTQAHENFAAFVAQICQARMEGGIEHLRYHSPSTGVLETGWDRSLFVDGEEIVISGYPRFANPFCHAPFDSEVVSIHAGADEVEELKIINP